MVWMYGYGMYASMNVCMYVFPCMYVFLCMEVFSISLVDTQLDDEIHINIQYIGISEVVVGGFQRPKLLH